MIYLLYTEIPNYPFLLGVGLVMLIITGIILKMIFRVDRHIKNQEEQLDLLRDINAKLHESTATQS